MLMVGVTAVQSRRREPSNERHTNWKVRQQHATER